MEITIKILVMLTCGGLNALGGFHCLWCRRYVMPVLLGGEAAFLAWEKNRKDWWAGLLVLPVIGTLCLKYFSPNAWGRSLWLFLQAFVIGIGLTVTGHVAWYSFVAYIAAVGVYGWLYKDWEQLIGDSGAGILLGSIVFVVH